MTETQREIELKLELGEDALKRLKSASAPDGFAVERAVTRTLRSIYFDTPDLALKGAKWSLRVRKVGRDWVQTVKAGTGISGGLSTPREVEVTIAAPVPDLTQIQDAELRDGVWALIDGKPLDAVFETEMRRTTRLFTTEAGTAIELALDAGEIRTEAETVPLFEAEFELKTGPVDDLFRLAKTLKGTETARFSATSKAGRGYALLSGGAAPVRPQNARPAQISAKTDTAETAFRAVLRSCLTQIAANRDAILDTDDPEGPHQMRVGLRRLRSALRVHRKYIDPERHAALDANARALAARVGALRDLDVLTDEIVAPVEAIAGGSVAVDRLHDTIAAERAAERLRLREAVQSASVNEVLFDLGAMAEGNGWQRQAGDDDTPAPALTMPVTDFARAALEKRWKAAAKLGVRIDDLTLEERHDLRKTLKKLRYVLEFYQPLFKPKTVKPFLKTLKRLQDVFGYLNDVVMAQKLAELAAARGDDPTGDPDGDPGSDARALMLAAGFVMGWHERRAEEAWSHARAQWDDTRHAEKFWR
ncbi:CYTH and CHAD domain-containing protein [Stappia sp.]|uniref:CYTH and CHAD domain-containing protein n=1 Tax=Stappia sp. TaxID=1870903 RepID=UPI0032D9446C